MEKQQYNKQYYLVKLLSKLNDKKIVDKDLRDLMEKDGMTRFKFYIAFQLACTYRLITQKFNGRSYNCSLTEEGKEELKLFKFMLKESFLKNRGRIRIR